MVQRIIKAAPESERPMRWPAAQALARSATTKILKKWDEFETRLIRWLPGSVDVTEAKKEIGPYLPHVEKDIHGDMCGCGSCSGPGTSPLGANNARMLVDMEEKAMSDGDLRRLRTQMAQYFNSTDIQEFERLFDDILSEYMVGEGGVITEGGLFNDFYLQAFRVGGKKAYEDAKSAVRLADKNTRAWFYKYVPEITQVDATALYVQRVYKEGFKLLSAGMKRYKGTAMKAITEGMAEGKDWLTIARSIHKTVGAGARWQWKRLVRTEMTGAIDKESKARYKDMRVPFVKFSLVPGACEICQGIKGQNGGYYKLASAPGIPENTHPNCRCRWIPVYNIPRKFRIPG